MAEMALAEKAWPHSSSVIALTYAGRDALHPRVKPEGRLPSRLMSPPAPAQSAGSARRARSRTARFGPAARSCGTRSSSWPIRVTRVRV